MSLKSRIQDPLPPSYHRFVRWLKIWRSRNDLNALAILFKTDKWGKHWYTQHYQRYFQPLKNNRLNILEIGVGGYQDCASGGESLRMWKMYFRNSRVVGIDIYDKSRLRERRIDIRLCDQTDAQALTRLSEEYGGFDIVIDDGSHLNLDVIRTFQILFPLMRGNGIYVVEDTQTAYWPTWGGGIGSPHASMTFFKALTDGLNYAEYPNEQYRPTYFDKNIVEIAFFHNLIFVRKGSNEEESNAPNLIKKELQASANPAAAGAGTLHPCPK